MYNDVHDAKKAQFNEAMRSGFAFLALTLLVALILRANNHYFAVSFDNFAFIAHRLYRRSYFHFEILPPAERLGGF